VDFLIVEKRQPRVLVECKLSDTALSPQLLACVTMVPKGPVPSPHERSEWGEG
jgi:hypothetical protein